MMFYATVCMHDIIIIVEIIVKYDLPTRRHFGIWRQVGNLQILLGAVKFQICFREAVAAAYLHNYAYNITHKFCITYSSIRAYDTAYNWIMCCSVCTSTWRSFVYKIMIHVGQAWVTVCMGQHYRNTRRKPSVMRLFLGLYSTTPSFKLGQAVFAGLAYNGVTIPGVDIIGMFLYICMLL